MKSSELATSTAHRSAAEAAAAMGGALNPYSPGNVKSVAWQYLLGRVLTGCGGFVYLIVLVRRMDAAAFAGFVTMAGFAATVGLLSGLGLDKVVTRYVPEGRLLHVGPKLNRLIATLLLARLLVLVVAALVTCLAWPLLARIFAPRADAPPLALILLIVGFNLFQFVAVILQALVQQRPLTLIAGAQWTARLAVVAAMIGAGMSIGLDDALWISAVPELVGTVALLLVLRAYLRGISRHRTAAESEAEAEVEAGPWPCPRQVLTLSAHNYGYAWLVAAPQGNSMVVVAASLVAVPYVAAYGFFAGLIDRIKSYLPLMLILNLVEPILTAGYMKERNFNKLCEQAVLLYKVNCLLVTMLAVWTAIVALPLTSALTNGRFLEYAFVLPALLLQLALGSRNLVLQIVVNSIGRSAFLPLSGMASLLGMALVLIGLIGGGAARYFFLAPLIYELINSYAIILLLRMHGYRYPSTMAFHAGVGLAAVMAYFLCDAALSVVGNPIVAIAIAGAALGVGLVFGAGLYVLPLLGKHEWAMLRMLLRDKKMEPAS